MITFDEALDLLRSRWPDYRFAPYGYETDDTWIALPRPETMGGHVASVSKASGAMRWITTYSSGYSQNRRAGRWPDAAPA